MLNVTLVSCNVQRNFSRTCLNIVDLCLVSYRPCTKGSCTAASRKNLSRRSCTRLLQRELAESNLVLMQRCLESPLNPRRPLHSPHSPPSPHSSHSPHSHSPHSPHTAKHSIHVTTSIPFSYCCVVKPKQAGKAGQAGQAGQAGRTTDLPSVCK